MEEEKVSALGKFNIHKQKANTLLFFFAFYKAFKCVQIICVIEFPWSINQIMFIGKSGRDMRQNIMS